MLSRLKAAYRRVETFLRRKVGQRGFPTAVACAFVALLTPTLSLLKTLRDGQVHHLQWLLLTPVFALLAKLFIGVDWVVAHRLKRVLLIAALLVAASLEILYLGRLLGVKLAL